MPWQDSHSAWVPSTCVQFGARREKSFDDRMAGYRAFTLSDDGFRTHVQRLRRGLPDDTRAPPLS